VTPVTRKRYQESLDALRGDVVGMGELVLDRLEKGLESLSTGDEALAREVIDGDDAVNEIYLDLEDRCIDLFALQQPVAGDLRFVAASFKIITDLERIADLATNLGRYALSGDEGLEPEVSIGDIGDVAIDLVERSLRAYESGDVDACHRIAADDDELDALCLRASESLARDLIEHEAGDLIEHEAGGDGPWTAERLLDDVSTILLAVRDLERVGDHAVNVAARTLYMVENDPALLY